MLVTSQDKTIHCLGIGGAGVGAIAELLLRQGYKVSGSDVSSSKLLNHLVQIGAKVYPEHNASNIENADIVVYSTAITDDNPELKAAYEKKLEVCHRAEMLARIMKPFKKITVAGTHGKTTTSSMMANLLLAAGIDPSFAIGGWVQATQSNSYLGKGEWFVAEADESDASFLYLESDIAIVTNIDEDHMQTYDHDVQKLLIAFEKFLNKLLPNGLAVLCIDDDNIKTIIPHLKNNIITYGQTDLADWQLTHFVQEGMTSYFAIKRKNLPTLRVSLQMPGVHNALNAIATAIVAHELGLSDEQITVGLTAFAGVGRRFQMHGEVTVEGGMALILEDYGHHPREVAAIISAVRACWPDRRLFMIFQPHRYSRTRDLFHEFVDVLQKVDVLFLTPVYAATEPPIEGADSAAIATALLGKGQSSVLVQSLENLHLMIKEQLCAGDIVIFQGAGNIGHYAKSLVLWESS